MNTRHKIHIISMGCAKNLVDSEKLMAQIRHSNIELTPTLEGADVAVINTCGFIESAKKESLNAIVAGIRRKNSGKLKKVYAMGCLTERYRQELQEELPEVDRFFGSNQMYDVLQELGAEYKYELLGDRVLTTPGHTAYLKISEGCDNPCSFCAIPLMRGKHFSRPKEEIIGEAGKLAEMGVRELVIIAQDTTYYGLDIYGKRMLPDLLASLADVQGIEWVRLMYAYPAKFPREVLGVMAAHPRICKYLDMPVQHAADSVLKSMRRGISSARQKELIDTIRHTVPGITLRTTLIVGYPSETSAEFDELLHFVQQVRFDRLGVFVYSQEDDTTAFPLGDPIAGEEKERRRELVMEIQRGISQEKNRALVGTTQRVLVDRLEGALVVGRTEKDAPEVDHEVSIRTENPPPVGSFVDVDIVDASEYDLFATMAD